MDDLLNALHALRPLWLPSQVLSLAAGAGLVLIVWGDAATLGNNYDWR